MIFSVINQNYSNWELIIVDDDSEESQFYEVKDFIKIDTRIILVRRNSMTKGPSACRNEGAILAKGNYIIFLDSDDLLKDFCLKQRSDIVCNNNEIDIAVFKIENFKDTPGDLDLIFNRDLPDVELVGSFIQNNNPWAVHAPIWRKSFFKKMGGFDEQFLFMEDPEIHLRALRSGAKLKVCYSLPSDCYYRIHQNDKTKEIFYYNSIYYRILFYKKIIVENSDSDFYKRNAPNIRIGIFNLINHFLFSRKNEFQQLYNDLILLMKQSNLFSSIELWKIKMLMELGNKRSFLIKYLKLKGICYKLLPKN